MYHLFIKKVRLVRHIQDKKYNIHYKLKDNPKGLMIQVVDDDYKYTIKNNKSYDHIIKINSKTFKHLSFSEILFKDRYVFRISINSQVDFIKQLKQLKEIQVEKRQEYIEKKLNFILNDN